MTEAEWLAAADPGPMLRHLRDLGGASDRKLRLFAAACCRRVWELLPDRNRSAVEVAERFADGEIAPEQAVRAADAAYLATFVAPDGRGLYGEGFAAYLPLRHLSGFNDWDEAHYCPPLDNTADAAALVRDALRPGERAAQAALVRCIFGNPLRPAPSIAPSVLAFNGGTVAKLAAAIYEGRAFDRLPVLADALEDAGCADADLLGRCRSGGEHVRGCWVVDLVLGKR